MVLEGEKKQMEENTMIHKTKNFLREKISMMCYFHRRRRNDEAAFSNEGGDIVLDPTHPIPCAKIKSSPETY